MVGGNFIVLQHLIVINQHMGFTPECGVHNPGIRNTQNELHWYLTTERGNPIFQ